MDCRVKPGNDDGDSAAISRRWLVYTSFTFFSGKVRTGLPIAA